MPVFRMVSRAQADATAALEAAVANKKLHSSEDYAVKDFIRDLGGAGKRLSAVEMQRRKDAGTTTESPATNSHEGAAMLHIDDAANRPYPSQIQEGSVNA